MYPSRQKNRAKADAAGLKHLRTSKKTYYNTVGLWGELYVIERSTNPEKIMQWWNKGKKNTFDFRAEGEILEVKTCVARQVHHLTSEQLQPVHNTKILIASIAVESPEDLFCPTPERHKKSIQDLFSSIERRVGEKGAKPLKEAIFSRLGAEVNIALGQKFFLRHRDLYHMPDIPSMIRNQKLELDFSELQPIDSGTLARNGGLFETIIPVFLST
jgi:uncharacterized protein YndB with AHSA1/START domain